MKGKKTAKLRARVVRLHSLHGAMSKLFSPNLEEPLTFLDDRLLPATSNAVERGNRRHRKMQKSHYRVRTQEHISQRIALDMYRDVNLRDTYDTMHTLHAARGRQTRKTA